VTNNNIIADLRKREASNEAHARDAYRQLVERVANGNEPTAAKAEKILAKAGHSAEKFAEHVSLAKEIAAQRQRAASLGTEEAMHDELEAAAEARTAFIQEKERALTDLARREKESEERLSAARRKIDMARRAGRSLAELEERFSGSLGEHVPARTSAPESKASVQWMPATTSPPKGYDRYDPQWERRLNRNGTLSYWYRGKLVR